MNILLLLIPLSIVLVGLIGVVLFWAISSGQFDDLDDPSQIILLDDDQEEDKNRLF